ncbi:MAG: hypothetical protein HKN91_03470 [Acidimicrobiia bacterium]|nr:hypothetical protein [Acidimicrobiia bacterium]
MDLTEFATGAGVTLATSADCPGLTEAIEAGSVTWSDGAHIWEGAVDAATTCLFHVVGELNAIEWAPQGDRMLVNNRLVVGGPANGKVAPAGIEWSFTAPTGLNLIGIDDGRLVKWLSGTNAVTVIDPISNHATVAYHPSGLHLAVGGTEQPEDADLDPTDGIFITGSDGADPVNLVLGLGATIRDISFANDGSQMYFIAEHDGLIHFHSTLMIPDVVEDTLVLGAGAEEWATTHATASGGGRIEFAKTIVHPTLPSVAAWTTAQCEPVGSRGFQIIAGADASLVQAIGPASAIGFLNSDPTRVIVVAVSGSCNGLRDVGFMTASLETGETNNVPIAGNVTVAAVRNISAPHKHDLVGVEIVGFA